MSLRLITGLLAAAGLSCLAVPASGGERAAGSDRLLVLERVVTEWGAPRAPKPDAEGEDGGEPEAAPEPLPEETTPDGKTIVRLYGRRATVKMAPQMLRERCEETGTTTIIRYDLKLVWLADDREKTFREMRFSEIDESAARARERLERRLPQVDDPALRAQLAGLLRAGTETPELRVERPEGRRTIAGESCTPIRATLGGAAFFEGWVASGVKPPVSGKRWMELGGVMPTEVAKALSEETGLLMEAVFPLPGGGRLEITTARVAEEKPAGGEFEDPATLGYKPTGRRAREEAAAGDSGGGK